MSLRSSLPVIHQTEATECGLACVVMIANYYGHDLDLNTMRQSHSASLKGASLKSIMGIADDLGLGARPLRLDMEHLEQLQCPAILHWDLNHFVVLKKVTKTRVHIHDPGRGLRVMSRSEFSDHFTGVALELTPTADFQAQTGRMRAHIGQLWTRLIGIKRAIAQTLILSVIIQMMVLAAPFYLQFTVDSAIPKSDLSLLLALALGFGGLALIKAISEAVREWAILVYGNQMSFQMVANVFRHLIRLPVSYFEKRHVGDIISRMGSTTPIQMALTQSVVAILIDGAMALITLAVMFWFSPALAMIVLISVALLIVITLAIYPSMRRTQEEAIVTKAIENSHVIESIRASTTVKLFGREAQREANWRNLFADYINASVAYGQWVIGQKLAQDILIGLQIVIVIYFGAKMIIADASAFTIGMLFSFMGFRQYFTDSVTQLLQKGIEFRLLSLHLDRLSDILYADPEDLDDRDERAKPITDLRGEIELKNVSFRYSDTDPWILKEYSLTIPAGQMLTLTGKSGGGKTTLMKLMLGLYEPTSGQVLIDGVPLADLRLRDWRQSLGVVMQDDKLMSGTIADNISFFDPQMDMARIMKAAKAARIHDEIAAIPMNYLSMVGDMGSILSGGQKQRVLLARALYHEPKVLFLDEGTANLDEQTEREIADVISAMTLTRVIIAHRPEFINRADETHIL